MEENKMGLFDKIKKKNSKAVDNDSVYREIFGIICDGDSDALEEMEKCLGSARLFAMENYEMFDRRGIVPSTASEFKIKWLGCVEIMIKHGYVREFDYKVDFEDFYEQFGSLKIVQARGILPADEEIYLDYEIGSWINCIDHCWGKSGMCVGGIDIDSDSYVVFVCTVEQLDKLSRLAESVGRKISKAGQM